MFALARAAFAIVVALLLVPSVAVAQAHRRHKTHMHHARTSAPMPYVRGYAYGSGPYGPNSADPYPPTAADDPYNPYAPPGAAIRALARRNQYAPGVTNELAPDNIATATGGPSGGVPGFSSH